MPGPGFVHEPLDMKVIILYIMARVAAPIDYATLTDLSLCDGGIDYFLFAQAVDQLIDSGHLTKDDQGLYAITEKGRTNGGAMESSVSSVVRDRCDKALARVNTVLRRNAQVTGQVVRDELGRCYVELGLADDAGSLLSLQLAVPDSQRGEEIAQRFRARAEDTFNAILSYLLQETEETE